MTLKEKINHQKMDILANSVLVQLTSRFQKQDIEYFLGSLKERLDFLDLPEFSDLVKSDSCYLVVTSFSIERD